VPLVSNLWGEHQEVVILPREFGGAVACRLQRHRPKVRGLHRLHRCVKDDDERTVVASCQCQRRRDRRVEVVLVVDQEVVEEEE
jgi:hypothetical protein